MERTEAQQAVDRQRAHFLSGGTLDVASRRRALERLRDGVLKHESTVVDAVHADMRRAPMETFVFEIGMILTEVEFALAHLDAWAGPTPVPSSPEQPGALASIHPEPYGVALIQSAWNYPIMQLFAPLVGALAAGNTAILRPASTSPHCARAAATLAADTFAPELVACLTGPSSLTAEIIEAPVDYVFFTGSPKVARTVMELAARQLTPVTLELGGKSPALVDRSADIALAARKVAWGKLCNAGQICLAVDHVYVHREVMDDFVKLLMAEIEAMVGPTAEKSPDLGRIINADNFSRIQGYLQQGTVAYGGAADPFTRYIEPTVLVGVSESDAVMQDEVFGPVLPVLPFEDLGAWIAQQRRKPKPLGLYVFAGDLDVSDRVVRAVPAGGVCVNDTMVHSVSPFLPFGGVGNSGLGAYHGKYSFDTFSHHKPVLDATCLQMDWRYMPYAGKLELLRAQLGLAS